MKSVKLALIATGIVLSASAYSQTETTQKDSAAVVAPATQPVTTTSTSDTGALGIGQTRLLVKPNFGPHYIAVLGNYSSSPETASTEKNVTISGDEENPGKIWIEGLTDAKIYALRKEMAGTYKIPVQKVNDKTIEEGTVVYDDNNKQINICLGCKYKDASPADAFTSDNTATASTTSKKKKIAPVKKVISFTGSKTDAGTAALSK